MSIFLNGSYITIISIQVLFIYILFHLNVTKRNNIMEKERPKNNNFEIEEMIETHEEHIDKVNKEVNKQSEIFDKFFRGNQNVVLVCINWCDE